MLYICMRFFLHIRPFFIGSIFVLGFLLVSPKPALADPHAVFFTVTGQQQMFFNVLAALNQTDYVETPELREQTLAKREAVVGEDGKPLIPKNTDPPIVATETNLANLLTRGVTLEGQDVWTSYMAFQSSLEVQRRREFSAFLSLVCEQTLGIKKCDPNSGESAADAKKRKENTYVVNPLSENRKTAQLIQDIVSSGTAEDQARRKEVIENYDPENPTREYVPFSGDIASLNKTVEDDPQKKAILKRYIGSAATTGSSSINSALFAEMNVDENTGDITYSEEADIPTMVQSLTAHISAPLAIGNIIDSAIENQSEIASYNQNGFIPVTYPSAKVDGNGTITSVEVNHNGPSASRPEQFASALTTTGTGAVTRYSAPSEENIPGTVSAVTRTGSGSNPTARNSGSTGPFAQYLPNSNGVSNPQVAGIQSGQVAGTSTSSGNNTPYNEDLGPIASADRTNYQPFLLEPPLGNTFAAYFSGLGETNGCQGSCSVDSIINSVIGN